MVNQRPFYERRFALPLRLPPCGVRGGQPKGEPPLADFKFHAARVRICVGLAALAGVSCGIGGQPVLEVGVVGADID